MAGGTQTVSALCVETQEGKKRSKRDSKMIRPNDIHQFPVHRDILSRCQ